MKYLSAVVLIIVAAIGLKACGEENVSADHQTKTSGAAEVAVPEFQIPGEDLRERISFVQENSAQGDEIWPGYSQAPFGLILMEGEQETLFCHKGEAAGWANLGTDPVTACSMKARARTFAPHLLATFPAVDGISTIVVGTPETTNRTPGAWSATLLHEHFHQYQNTLPDYYGRLMGLDLHGGDQTGMWMLNYPFPYEDSAVGTAYQALGLAMVNAIDAIGSAEFDNRLATYLSAREAAEEAVSEKDWLYVQMQFWVEGVARWTDLTLARKLGVTNAEIKTYADETRAQILEELHAIDMASDQRVVFYALGAGEAMLHEAIGPEWRSRYFDEPFTLNFPKN